MHEIENQNIFSCYFSNKYPSQNNRISSLCTIYVSIYKVSLNDCYSIRDIYLPCFYISSGWRIYMAAILVSQKIFSFHFIKKYKTLMRMYFCLLLIRFLDIKGKHKSLKHKQVFDSLKWDLDSGFIW